MMELLFNFCDILASAPDIHSRITISNMLTETRATISTGVGQIKCYLEACGDVCHEYQQFYDHHLRHGSELHVGQLSLAESTLRLQATAQRALAGWVTLKSGFKTDSRPLSGLCSKYMMEGDGAHGLYIV